MVICCIATGRRTVTVVRGAKMSRSVVVVIMVIVVIMVVFEVTSKLDAVCIGDTRNTDINATL
jgi:zona occludens toxin (predicted ATPase)